MLAEGLGLSGIVSILFTGVVSFHLHFLFFLFPPHHFLFLLNVLSTYGLSFRLWSAIRTRIYQKVHSDLCRRFFIWYHLWLKLLCKSGIPVFEDLLYLYFPFLLNNFRNACFCLMCRFIYMGFDIAMEKHSWSHVGFIFFSIVSFTCSLLYIL